MLTSNYYNRIQSGNQNTNSPIGLFEFDSEAESTKSEEHRFKQNTN